MKKRLLAIAALATPLLLASQSAHAAFSLDTTEVLATIANGVVAIAAIGTAVLSLVVVIRIFAWTRKAL